MRLVLIDRPTREAAELLPAGAEPADLGTAVRHHLAGWRSSSAAFLGGDVACFVPEYMADVYRARSGRRVNDLAAPGGRRPAAGRRPGEGRRLPDRRPRGQAWSCCDADGEVLVARVARADLAELPSDSARRFP